MARFEGHPDAAIRNRPDFKTCLSHQHRTPNLARTRRSDPSGEGITRVRRGRGFSYQNAAGKAVRDEAELERIRALAIPPAWTDVWICADELGHIQAVGTDAAGRRQYLYHEAWRERRDREKFKRLPEFAQALLPAREALAADLKLRGLVRERVMACAVRLLDIGTFRVGGEDYAEENESYGLATLERRHVSVSRGRNRLRVRRQGRHRSERRRSPTGSSLPTILALKRRRGQSARPAPGLPRAAAGDWRDVSSDEINQWLKDLVGAEYSAKDFRTWNGTVLAAVKLAGSTDAPDRAKAVDRRDRGGGRDPRQHARRLPRVLRRSAGRIHATSAARRSPPALKRLAAQGHQPRLRRPRGDRAGRDQAAR